MNWKNVVLWVLIVLFSMGSLGLLYGIVKTGPSLPAPSPLATSELFKGVQFPVVASTPPAVTAPPPNASIPVPVGGSLPSLKQISRRKTKSKKAKSR